MTATDIPSPVLLQQGIGLYRQGRFPDAEDALLRVIVDDPGNPSALHMLGLLAFQRNDNELAEQLISRSLQMDPHSRVYHDLGVIQQRRADLDAAVATYRTALKYEPGYVDAATNLIFSLDLHPYAPPSLLLAERRAFDAAFCRPLTLRAAPHPNDRDTERRLRVGYVSADFRNHSAGSVLRGFLLDHDPERVETYLYSTAEAHDDVTPQFRAAAAVWREVAELSDAALAETILADGIDVLVDCGGYARGGRLLAFAHKPAPVQVTGWGYATGTGLDCMDYLMADAAAVPAAHEARYAERIARLPAMLAYAPGEYPEIAERPQLRNGHRTYGNLGRAVKIHAPVLAAWAAVLRADPTSRLLLKSIEYEDPAMRNRIGRALLSLGVAMDRVELRSATSRYDHLAAYNEIDVALDSFPQGGGVTSLDAALMGVPTVTLAGENVPGRLGASIMRAIGCDWWVATDMEQYAELARSTLPERGRVRDALLGSIICRPRDYAGAVEDAYRAMWRTWVAEQEQEVAA